MANKAIILRKLCFTVGANRLSLRAETDNGVETMFSRQPMTREEAIENVTAMRAESSRPARKKLITLALQIGNLSDGAREVYEQESKQ